MSMLVFMPWCPIDTEYEIGEISLIPLKRHGPIEGLDALGQCQVNAIMGMYKDLESKPPFNAALVRYSSKGIIDDLKDDELQIMRELVQLACFAGLAGREYFSQLGSYCNSDSFLLYTQRFETVDYTAITTRRCDGGVLSAWPIDEITVTIPVHCSQIRSVSLDTGVLSALLDYRATIGVNEWGGWQSAISCFNKANTDGDNVSHQIEWVLLCGAFEHIMDAKSDYKDVASKFESGLVPAKSIKASGANRGSGKWENSRRTLRYEWMREFYGIRGDFAHGKLYTRRPTAWNLAEHLFLARVAFPLLVKSLLGKAQRYGMTDEDLNQIDIFERYAGIPDFLRDPPDQRRHGDSHWTRLLKKARDKRAYDEGLQSLMSEDKRDSDQGPEEGRG